MDLFCLAESVVGGSRGTPAFATEQATFFNPAFLDYKTDVLSSLHLTLFLN